LIGWGNVYNILAERLVETSMLIWPEWWKAISWHCKKDVCHWFVMIDVYEPDAVKLNCYYEGRTGLTVKPSSIIFLRFRYINISEYSVCCV